MKYSLFCVVLLLFQTAASNAQEPSQRDWMNRLMPVIHQNILTKSGYRTAYVPRRSIFRNSIDWHSSVHGHWALLAMARISGNEEEQQFVLNRLSEENLARERTELADNEDLASELPYGQSWLLLLLDEMEKHVSPLPPEAAALKAETSTRVRDWLLKEKVNCDGEHKSWAFSYLLFSLSHPDPDDLVKVSDRLSELHCESAPVKEDDFVYYPALEDVLYGTLKDSEKNGLKFFQDRIQQGIGAAKNSHGHADGNLVMRFWPMAEAASSGNSEAKAEFDTCMNDFISKPELWQEDFRYLSHWIPQFLWFGIWLEMGKK